MPASTFEVRSRSVQGSVSHLHISDSQMQEPGISRGSPEKRRKVEVVPSRPVAGSPVHGDCDVQQPLPSTEVTDCPPELVK